MWLIIRDILEKTLLVVYLLKTVQPYLNPNEIYYFCSKT
jgi:hypothetical protein